MDRVAVLRDAGVIERLMALPKLVEYEVEKGRVHRNLSYWATYVLAKERQHDYGSAEGVEEFKTLFRAKQDTPEA